MRQHVKKGISPQEHRKRPDPLKIVDLGIYMQIAKVPGPTHNNSTYSNILDKTMDQTSKSTINSWSSSSGPHAIMSHNVFYITVCS